MIDYVAATVFDSSDLPMLLWVFFYTYLLIYGPWVIIPVGLALVIRLFFVKRRTQRATVWAAAALGFGILLAVIALVMKANGVL